MGPKPIMPPRSWAPFMGLQIGFEEIGLQVIIIVHAKDIARLEAHGIEMLRIFARTLRI